MNTFLVKVKTTTLVREYEVVAAGWYDAMCEAFDIYGNNSVVSVKPL